MICPGSHDYRSLQGRRVNPVRVTSLPPAGPIPLP